jgi:hypothetical protein
MPTTKVDFNTVRSIAAEMPGVEESTTYGSPCFKACGKLMTCIAIHSSAEPDSLAVRVGFDGRAEMIADDPAVYYLTDHYVNYPFVLVRMKRIQPGPLKDLLSLAWRLTTAKTTRAKTAKSPARKRAQRPAPPRARKKT